MVLMGETLIPFLFAPHSGSRTCVVSSAFNGCTRCGGRSWNLAVSSSSTAPSKEGGFLVAPQERSCSWDTSLGRQRKDPRPWNLPALLSGVSPPVGWLHPESDLWHYLGRGHHHLCLDFDKSLLTGLPISNLAPFTVCSQQPARGILLQNKIRSCPPLPEALPWLPFKSRQQPCVTQPPVTSSLCPAALPFFTLSPRQPS